MPRRLAVSLLAGVTALAGCGSSSSKSSARDTERFLEGKGTPHVICTEGSDGWDYTCTSSGRKIGVDVGKRGPTELSNWVPDEEPLQVGPGGEGVAVHARFVDEASSVCKEAASMISRLPRPVSRIDTLSQLDRVLDLNRQEVIQLEAIKPPVALLPEYTLMLGALGQVVNDEMELRDGIATRQTSTRRAALKSRARDARQANEIALRLGLPACSNAATPLPGIAPRPH
jgi:hypothetical protein